MSCPMISICKAHCLVIKKLQIFAFCHEHQKVGLLIDNHLEWYDWIREMTSVPDSIDVTVFTEWKIFFMACW